MLWVLGTGRPWRELPASWGPWQTAYDRFRGWENDGRLAQVFDRLIHHPARRALQAATPTDTG